MKEIIQFAYKHGLPPSLPVVDCRTLPNPYRRNWTDEALKDKVRQTPGFEELVSFGVQLIAQHECIHVGCTHGRHRSVAVAEEISRRTGVPVRCVVPAGT